MKRSTILAIGAAFAFVVPVSQAATYNGGEGPVQAGSASARALMLRSEALNREYHLGAYRQTSTRPDAAALRATMLRSEALNRLYKLGNDAPTPAASTGTSWGGANPWAIGGVCAAFVLLLLGASRLVRRPGGSVKTAG